MLNLKRNGPLQVPFGPLVSTPIAPNGERFAPATGAQGDVTLFT